MAMLDEVNLTITVNVKPLSKRQRKMYRRMVIGIDEASVEFAQSWSTVPRVYEEEDTDMTKKHLRSGEEDHKAPGEPVDATETAKFESKGEGQVPEPPGMSPYEADELRAMGLAATDVEKLHALGWGGGKWKDFLMAMLKALLESGVLGGMGTPPAAAPKKGVSLTK